VTGLDPFMAGTPRVVLLSGYPVVAKHWWCAGVAAQIQCPIGCWCCPAGLTSGSLAGSYVAKTITLNDRGCVCPFNLQIWDTAGQERFRSMVSPSCPSAGTGSPSRVLLPPAVIVESVLAGADIL
jgi:hypothetical protein